MKIINQFIFLSRLKFYLFSIFSNVILFCMMVWSVYINVSAYLQPRGSSPQQCWFYSVTSSQRYVRLSLELFGPPPEPHHTPPCGAAGISGLGMGTESDALNGIFTANHIGFASLFFEWCSFIWHFLKWDEGKKWLLTYLFPGLGFHQNRAWNNLGIRSFLKGDSRK